MEIALLPEEQILLMGQEAVEYTKTVKPGVSLGLINNTSERKGEKENEKND